MNPRQPTLKTGEAPPADKPAPDRETSGEDLPAAGPHADPDLTDRLKTPGAGSMPEVGSDNQEVDPGAG
jgi:hypothetical protein